MKQNLVLDMGESLEKENLIAIKKDKNVLIKHFYIKNNEKGKTIKGDYFTICFDDKVLYKEEKILGKAMEKVLKSFLAKYHKNGPILIVGLGNSSVLADSFGGKTLDKLIATNQYNDFLTIPKVALFAPETVSKTGISSFKLIEMVVNLLKPDLIILIDSFLTKEKKYLNRTIEVNDCGVIFADELRHNKKIDKNTFHIPVLSIGCPTMVKMDDTYLEKYTLGEDLEIISSVVSKTINELIIS